MRYLPHMLLATAIVAVLPALAGWWLRDRGVLSSALAYVLFCVLVSLGLSVIGAAYWKQRRHATDMLFSELLVWGGLGGCGSSAGFAACRCCSNRSRAASTPTTRRCNGELGCWISWRGRSRRRTRTSTGTPAVSPVTPR
jgi:hypothetical protein